MQDSWKMYSWKVAMQLVPQGYRPVLGELRERIAAALEREITSALTRQREETFPDLAITREALTDRRKQLDAEDQAMKKKYKEKEKELEERMAAVLKEAESTKEALADQAAELRSWSERLKLQQLRLDELVKAFDAYMAWFDGDGTEDEAAKRMRALHEAYKAYKKQEKST